MFRKRPLPPCARLTMFLGVIKHKPQDGAMPPPGLSPLGALREEDEHR